MVIADLQEDAILRSILCMLVFRIHDSGGLSMQAAVGQMKLCSTDQEQAAWVDPAGNCEFGAAGG